MQTPAAAQVSSTVEIVRAVLSLAWPLLVAIVLWKLFPAIKAVIESRTFVVKVAGMEITVQQVSDKLRLDVEDLQKKVSELRALGENKSPQAAPHPAAPNPAAPVDRVGERKTTAVQPRILWVDDRPSGNAFEIARLESEGTSVTTARSTEQAMQLLDSARPKYSLVITDMGRREDRVAHPKAGLELIEAIRGAGWKPEELPILVYSAKSAERLRPQILNAGAQGVTASPVELFELLHQYLPAY